MVEQEYAAPTERLDPSARATRFAELFELAKVGAWLWAIVLLILYAARTVVLVNSQTFAVLAACGVGAAIWLAFGKRGE